ncbi:glycosyl transferase group 1 [Halothece sp. PCC 7418]|uniref:glycosyltransferase n=1 Tax=Halothece sp. (strain PCC 7418) TaxID=65093 RepID=UPI0002A06180|nr:glycosyltransferase [Halothece sp. PCC 7418]AFZ44033.1 glycosyl transferase group 1 [Halothece sp. PCC 7418]
MNDSTSLIALFAGGGVGGSQTNVSVYLLSGIALQGYKVEMVTLTSTKSELLAFYREVEGFEQVNVYPLQVSNASRSLLPLVQYYRHQQPTVMFSQLTYFNAIATIAKTLAHVQTANILLEGTLLSKMIKSDSQFSPKLMLVPLLAKFTYPFAQGFIGKSQDVLLDTKQVVGQRFNRVPSTVLPNPYPFDRFRKLAQETVDHPWFKTSEVPIIIASGRLCEQKGFDTLLQAFAQVRSTQPCRLVILGEGPDRPKLEALIKRLQLTAEVWMPGRLSNPWKYVAHSTIFVLASRWEGWPSALMEAMACGLPVITTDCPGDGKKMVEHETNGLIVPTDNVMQLQTALLKLLQNQDYRAKIAKKAKESVLSYDYRFISQKYLSFADFIVQNQFTKS